MVGIEQLVLEHSRTLYHAMMISTGTRRLGAPRTLLSQDPVLLTSRPTTRLFSSGPMCYEDSSTPPTKTLNPRWLSDLKTRLGKCIQFGMNDTQTTAAGLLLAEVTRDWRSLLAGSDGYLTHPLRAGISSVPIDWGDQDAMGHVNNVQYVRFCETSRTNWTRKIGDHYDRPHKKQWDEMLTNKSYGLILKSIKVDYKFPMEWPDKISAYHKIRVMPKETDSSMLLDVMILSEDKQRIAAKAEEDVVVYNYKAGKKSTLPDYMLTQFKRQFEEQEVAKEQNAQRVREILGQVRALEQETWDREDAKEDLGSAT